MSSGFLIRFLLVLIRCACNPDSGFLPSDHIRAFRISVIPQVWRARTVSRAGHVGVPTGHALQWHAPLITASAAVGDPMLPHRERRTVCGNECHDALRCTQITIHTTAWCPS